MHMMRQRRFKMIVNRESKASGSKWNKSHFRCMIRKRIIIELSNTGMVMLDARTVQK